MAEEKKVNLLWSCAHALSTETHAERLLKSYYINTCRKLAKHNVVMPEDSVGPGRMCRRCGNEWSDGHYQLNIKPQRLAQNAKRRRLIAQLEAAKTNQQKGTGKLSTVARKRAKWLKKRMGSYMAVNCAICGHKTMLPLEKPKKRKQQPSETIKTATVAAPAGPKKKKKHKNKDIKATAQTQQRAAPTSTTTTATMKKPPIAAAGQSNKQKKQKKKKTAQSTTPTGSSSSRASGAPKVQSKTQKHNALLQLAAQLQKQVAQSASKTPQSRLQALLK
ncbi:CG1360 [Drosophila busckii]|uniref:CG1360 n=1 Tax=Drosophila busckii TaxID=30019 RepID=A0A0M4EW98_DROBS|nr:uncharacterized protein LOC108596265 [Drosophila busckii]ALC42032.1 CG1360 [Drosophila busckii]